MNTSMKKIKLTKNKYAIVDDEDFNYLASFNWHYKVCGYAAKKAPRNGGHGDTILMHRFIIGENKIKDKVVDHINGDKLDNRKSNLRICTFQENQMNKKKHKTNENKYKGVYFHKRDKLWYSCITCDYKQHFLGYTDTEVESVLNYNKKAKELFGEFANLNKIYG